MPYQTLLVHVADDAGNERRLAVAKALATRLEATLIGLHALPMPVATPFYGDVLPYLTEVLEAQREAAGEESDRLRAAFERVCAPPLRAEWCSEIGVRAKSGSDPLLSHSDFRILVMGLAPSGVLVRVDRAMARAAARPDRAARRG
jgi:nucleotide-binding universal stress UspA family protein